MAKKQHPNIKNTKIKDSFSNVPYFSDILAITEGNFGTPVKRRDRFINASYPPDDVSQVELRRFWEEPREKDRNFLESVKVKGKRRNEPSFQ